jgi:sulfate adenylyltransferase large subunit
MQTLESDLERRSLERPVLRFATAGSVDDGKSTLIGRLLFDSKAILEDQYEAVLRASRARGNEGIELALLTDGLRAEREQNITIDVAYRYFETSRRKFIIADTPGHEEYTRNMATGASTADLAVILVDARQGVLPQSKRHAAISSMLGIKHFVIAVNKMDLVDYSEKRFNEIVTAFTEATETLRIEHVHYFPISALYGDNIVEPGANMPWYTGPTLLSFLEDVDVEDRVLGPLRIPVQGVVRPHQDYRGLLGQVESGEVRVGDPVEVLPGNRMTSIRSLHTAVGETDAARRGQAVTVEIADDIDIGRGAMLVSPEHPPATVSLFGALVCWMNAKALRPGTSFVLLHTTRVLRALVHRVERKLDVQTLTETPAHELQMNEIGWISLETSQPIHADPYATNRTTGSFLLVDPETLVTHGAGILTSAHLTAAEPEAPKGYRVLLTGKGAVELAEAISKPLRFTLGPTILFDPQEVGESLEFFVDNLVDQGLTVVVAHAGEQPLSIYLNGTPVELPPDVTDVEALVRAIARPLKEYLQRGDGI